MTISEDGKFILRIQLSAALILAGLCGLTFFLGGKTLAAGVLAGGLLCLVNFRMLYRHTLKAVKLTALRSVAFTQTRYFVRIAISGVIIFALITKFDVNVIGLLLGLSVIMLSITGHAVYAYIALGGDD